MSRTSWFSRRLRPWYRENHRDLPWRRTRDPYRIWLSEVILQQTRVDQGTTYYHRFVEAFPTVADLAAASEDQVLRLWQGLGYYSRARNLRTAALQVMQEHQGTFPVDRSALLGLKGVGAYTAAAVASIAYGEPAAVVDGNVYRVLARVFGMDEPIDTTPGQRRFQELAQELIPQEDPGTHNQAVMELGATICTPRAPACPDCPLLDKCLARQQDRIAMLPVKTKRTRVRDRHFHYLHILVPGMVVLQRREAGDIWQGLYELPLIESAGDLSPDKLRIAIGKATGTKGWTVVDRDPPETHLLSHQRLHIGFWRVRPPAGTPLASHWKPVPPALVGRYGLPRPVERYLSRPSPYL